MVKLLGHVLEKSKILNQLIAVRYSKSIHYSVKVPRENFKKHFFLFAWLGSLRSTHQQKSR